MAVVSFLIHRNHLAHKDRVDTTCDAGAAYALDGAADDESIAVGGESGDQGAELEDADAGEEAILMGKYLYALPQKVWKVARPRKNAEPYQPIWAMLWNSTVIAGMAVVMMLWGTCVS